ncbi:hypothetical protein L2E82_36793 [Cichorium intybus]|uniref:Uncharacterized protein n=1 Tax=Cichorium intybus TaxID=13427 RepID=A0ACB9AD04_CICIN|nr:hypothetical protein L2E82_36793 [Cichorium intybus]
MDSYVSNLTLKVDFIRPYLDEIKIRLSIVPTTPHATTTLVLAFAGTAQVPTISMSSQAPTATAYLPKPTVASDLTHSPTLFAHDDVSKGDFSISAGEEGVS